MKREIKFRGLRTDGKGWVIGVPYPIYSERKCFIIDNCQSLRLTQEDSIFQGVEVARKSVGQYTGLKAISRKKTVEDDVYEGDLFRGIEETDLGDTVEYYVVMWIPQRSAFYMIPADHYAVIRDNDVSREPEFSWLFDDAALYDFSHDIGLTKVGNIHEHKHLLK